VLTWLSVWDEVQICIWPIWYHCHSLCVAPGKPDWFWFYLLGISSPRYSRKRAVKQVLLLLLLLLLL